MTPQQRHTDALHHYAQALERVKSTPAPIGQKYPPGTRVHIAANLGQHMSHFQSGVDATVRYTYAHAYGGSDVRSYCLDIDGYGEVSWYGGASIDTRPNQVTFCGIEQW